MALDRMTVKSSYEITSATSSPVFDFGVRLFDAADVRVFVYADGAETQLPTSSYTVAPISEDLENGARITLNELPAAGSVLTIVREVDPLQKITLPNFGKIPSESLEKQLDRTIAYCQQIRETLSRTYVIPFGAGDGNAAVLKALGDFVSSVLPNGSSTISYAINAHHATVADNASYADNAGHANSADGLTQDGRAAFVTDVANIMSAGGYVPYAGSAGALTASAKADILSSAGGGGMAYPDYNHGAGLAVTQEDAEGADRYLYTTSRGGKEGYTTLSSNGGLILGTVQAYNVGGNAYIQLMAGANGDLEGAYLKTVFPQSGGSALPAEALLSIPIGPETDFMITCLNCEIETRYSSDNISTLSFYPYRVVGGSGGGGDDPDTTPPDPPVASANVTSATNQNVIVMASFTPDSVVKQYNIDSGAWTTYPAGGVVVSSNCVVGFRAADVAGNISSETVYLVDNIDKTAPVIELSGYNNSSTTSATSITATTESGLAIDWRKGNTGSWNIYSSAVDVTENGTWNFKAQDAAGNIGSASVTFTNISQDDVTAPVITLVGNTTTQNLQSDTLTASVNETATIEYSTDGGYTWETYTGPIMVDHNGTWNFRATDLAGNVGTASIIYSNIASGQETDPGHEDEEA